jgi:2-C-methyl-D-erythritol 2,4-cyclodiphosphate synthase
MGGLGAALLGAGGLGDIGEHFPPSDPIWKGVSSDRFLRHAVDLLRAKGAIIDHVDCTIIAEEPKVGPHRTIDMIDNGSPSLKQLDRVPQEEVGRGAFPPGIRRREVRANVT